MTASVSGIANTAKDHSQHANHLAALKRFAIILAVCLIPIILYVIFRACISGEGFWKFGRHFVNSKFVELFTIWLAVSGTAYAFLHDRDLNEQVANLERLEASLSTRRTAAFPAYLGEIGNLARTAYHLDIMTDCLDYGSFFAPEVHQEVHDAILATAKRTKNVRILVCGEVPEALTSPSGQKIEDYPNAAELVKEYCSVLRRDAGFVGWITRLRSANDPFLKEISESWFKRQEGGSNLKVDLKDTLPHCIKALEESGDDPEARDGDPILRSLLQLRQLWFARQLQDVAVKIQGLGAAQSLFFWMKYRYEERHRRDTSNDNAQFTFGSAARGPNQLGYTTHDPDLLNTFRDTFDEKFKDVERRGKPPWLMVLERVDIGSPPVAGSN